MNKKKFEKVDKTRESYVDTSKFGSLELSELLFGAVKKLFKVEEIYL